MSAAISQRASLQQAAKLRAFGYGGGGNLQATAGGYPGAGCGCRETGATLRRLRRGLPQQGGSGKIGDIFENDALRLWAGGH